jgi:phage protein D
MRRPIVQIIGQGGKDLIPGWGPALISVSWTDVDGGDSDELNITYSVSAPFQDSPAEGTRYRLLYGWDVSGLRDGGVYTYQSDTLEGDPESGYTLTITARASDFVDADKTVDSEHFEDTTVGEIIRQVAGKAGRQATVDPSIANIKVPYRLRWKQSSLGFAKELAEEFGGTLKPANGSWLVPRRNAGTTAGGAIMPTIVIPFRENQSFGITSEARGKYKDIGAGFFDVLKGVQELFEGTSIGSAARFLNLHPARTKEEAEHAGKAQGAEQARGTVSGSFEADGSITAMGGAPVKLMGFGASRDAADLVAASIEHTVSFEEDGGWLMMVEVENRERKT